MKKYILEIAVFMGGSIVMVYELVGSRVLAPFVGTSIFVWTSLIGVILASLSLGYWLGGKLSDREPHVSNFSWILFIASVFVFATWLFQYDILALSSEITDNRWRALVSAIALFVPASFFLGMLSPYAVRLKIQNLQASGQTVGTLYALSTLGSIVGTFAAGFWLIPNLGTSQILLLLALLLALTALLVYRGHYWWFKALAALLLLLFLVLGVKIPAVQADNFVDTDTAYNRVWIYDYDQEGQRVRMLLHDDKPHSAMFLDSNELVFPYTKYYDLVKYFKPDFQNSLMIGGAAYSYPKYFLQKYPDKYIDVVEIDPQITKLAREYFNLQDNARLQIIHQDGRIFLNNNTKQYDVIFGDAFSSYYSIPHHLTTQETVQHIYDSLSSDGVAIVNIISSVQGETGRFLQAEYATYNEVFDQLYLFLVNYPEQPEKVQNIMLVAVKGNQTYDFQTTDNTLTELFNNRYLGEVPTSNLILTDNFAPVDYLVNKIR